MFKGTGQQPPQGKAHTGPLRPYKSPLLQGEVSITGERVGLEVSREVNKKMEQCRHAEPVQACGEAAAPEGGARGLLLPVLLGCAQALPTQPPPPLQEPVLLPGFPEIITNLVSRNGRRSCNCQL